MRFAVSLLEARSWNVHRRYRLIVRLYGWMVERMYIICAYCGSYIYRSCTMLHFPDPISVKLQWQRDYFYGSVTTLNILFYLLYYFVWLLSSPSSAAFICSGRCARETSNHSKHVRIIMVGGVAQLVQHRTGTPLTQVRFLGAAWDFSSGVNFQCRLS